MVQSQKGLCQPPAPLPPQALRLWAPCELEGGENSSAVGSRQTNGVTALASPPYSGLRSRYSEPHQPGPLRYLVSFQQGSSFADPTQRGFLPLATERTLPETTRRHPRSLFFTGGTFKTCDGFPFQGGREFSASVALVCNEFRHISQGGGWLFKRCWVAGRTMSPQHPSTKPGEVWLSLKDAGSDKGSPGCLTASGSLFPGELLWGLGGPCFKDFHTVGWS